MENLDTVTQTPTEGISQKGRGRATLLKWSQSMEVNNKGFLEVNIKGFGKSGVVYTVTSFFNRMFQGREMISKHFSMFSICPLPLGTALHPGLLSQRGTTSSLPCAYRFEDSSVISGKMPSLGAAASLGKELAPNDSSIVPFPTASDSCRRCHPREAFTTCALWFFFGTWGKKQCSSSQLGVCHSEAANRGDVPVHQSFLIEQLKWNVLSLSKCTETSDFSAGQHTWRGTQKQWRLVRKMKQN